MHNAWYNTKSLKTDNTYENNTLDVSSGEFWEKAHLEQL